MQSSEQQTEKNTNIKMYSEHQSPTLFINVIWKQKCKRELSKNRYQFWPSFNYAFIIRIAALYILYIDELILRPYRNAMKIYLAMKMAYKSHVRTYESVDILIETS